MQQQIQRLVQPGQVLVRQVVPGQAQPVIRAMSLPAGAQQIVARPRLPQGGTIAIILFFTVESICVFSATGIGSF